jgi:hypothetical protein
MTRLTPELDRLTAARPDTAARTQRSLAMMTVVSQLCVE